MNNIDFCCFLHGQETPYETIFDLILIYLLLKKIKTTERTNFRANGLKPYTYAMVPLDTILIN